LLYRYCVYANLNYACIHVSILPTLVAVLHTLESTGGQTTARVLTLLLIQHIIIPFPVIHIINCHNIVQLATLLSPLQYNIPSIRSWRMKDCRRNPRSVPCTTIFLWAVDSDESLLVAGTKKNNKYLPRKKYSGNVRNKKTRHGGKNQYLYSESKIVERF